MPINLLSLQTKIHELGQKALARKTNLDQKLIICQHLLTEYADDLKTLQKAVEDAIARDKGIRCAIPVNEPLTSHLPAHLPTCGYTLIAADGSQINPDPHGSVMYGLINVGMFTLQKGSGNAPEIQIESELLYDEELRSSSGFGSEEWIALLRDVKERKALVEQTQPYSPPVLTLTDGPLELYHEPRKDPDFDKKFKEFQDALSDLALNKVITAGYVDRPRADLVVRMLELLQEPDPTEPRPLEGVTDLTLFRDILNPGERSAIFQLQSSSAKFYEGKKALHFFYINVGSETLPALARVEVPLWVAEDLSAVQLLQSTLVEQARQVISFPYPYALTRAHEIAVVRMDDKQELTSMIENELVDLGFPPLLISNKQSNKQFSGK